ncbi:hypothetical protein LS73_007890 [Helicobacter muridarum]|uniref:Uncharacterized protein n=1 Tax=Helicobacter muridarum TaxID=216 RepID=A0A099U2E4_9HELI|nr:hypothetical protein [Helicobacter muridarum]TLD99015.1 hypothetical protein LS73_007890 [Helicobacter muridarum]STQ85419.1 Uncharacterised protein [Helicobacter muridarum]
MQSNISCNLDTSNHSYAFIFLDCIFAVAISSFTFLSLAYLQEEMIQESKQEIHLYEEASRNLINAFKQNNPNQISIQTINNQSYTFLLFKGEASNDQGRNIISLHRLILQP